MVAQHIIFRIKHFLVYLAIPILLYSCAVSHPEKPAESYLKSNDSLAPSYITIPIETSVTDLEKMLNKQITGLVYADTSLDDNGGDNLMVKAWKQDNIKISLNNNVLSYTVPLKLWIKAGWKISKFGFEVGDFREVNAAIALKFKSTITLNSDWTINSATVADGFDWLSSPVMKIGPVDVPVTYLANLILKSNQNKLTSAIDKGFKEKINLRSYVKDSWNALQEPRKVNDTFDIWVKITPLEILTTPISGKNGKLVHLISIKTITQAFVGGSPPKGSLVPLPKLVFQDQIPSDFQVNLWTALPFTKLNELAMGYLHGKTFSEGKRTVTIQHVSLFGSEDKLIIYLILTGSYTGELYLEGTPYYNYDRNAIELKGLDYHIKTKQFLVKSSSWLFKTTLVNMISQKLSFSIKDELLSAKALLELNLKNYPLAEGIFLNAKLNDMVIKDIVLNKESIHTLIGINGKLNLNIKP